MTAVTPAEIAVGHSSPMSDDLRPTPEDYKQLAERCMELASECSAPTVAEALRALAVDYLTRAARLRRRGSIESLAPTTRRESQAPRPARRPRKREREGAGALQGHHSPSLTSMGPVALPHFADSSRTSQEVREVPGADAIKLCAQLGRSPVTSRA